MTVKIYIIYYSTYGHVLELAKREKAGVDSVDGCEGVLFQVKETLPQEVLDKMYAPPKDADIPLADVKQLTEADGFLFGFPTRYGNMSSQFKAFWDATGSLWQKGGLIGKAFGTFTSTATQGGGQEFTHASSLSNFIHHGMIYIPIGYFFGEGMNSVTEVRGASPWGAGTMAAPDGSRRPSELELQIAEFQGKVTAEAVKKLSAKS